jgi:cell volume regulation protein A
MSPMEKILIISSLLLLLSVAASKAASRFGIPALLVFLGMGMLAGPYGPGGLTFHSLNILQTTGTLALIAILFAGGLDTEIKSIRPILKSGLILSTLGVIVAAGMIGIFANRFLDGCCGRIHGPSREERKP